MDKLIFIGILIVCVLLISIATFVFFRIKINLLQEQVDNNTNDITFINNLFKQKETLNLIPKKEIEELTKIEKVNKSEQVTENSQEEQEDEEFEKEMQKELFNKAKEDLITHDKPEEKIEEKIEEQDDSEEITNLVKTSLNTSFDIKTYKKRNLTIEENN